MAAVALILPLAWELLYAVGVALKRPKKKKKRKKKERTLLCWLYLLFSTSKYYLEEDES